MNQANTPDATTSKPGAPLSVERPDPKDEPHPAVPQEDDPEIEKTEEQPS